MCLVVVAFILEINYVVVDVKIVAFSILSVRKRNSTIEITILRLVKKENSRNKNSLHNIYI